MSPARRVRDAAGALLVVYAARTLWAAKLLQPLYEALSGPLADTTFGARLQRGDVALVLEVAARAAPRFVPWAASWVLGFALLAPLLQTAWLCALDGASLREALAQATARYPAALLVRLLALCAALLLGGTCLGAVELGLRLARAPAPLETGTRALGVALAAGFGFMVASAHDLVLARIATGAHVAAALRNGVRSVSRRLLAANATWLALGLACALAADALGRAALPFPDAFGPLLVLGGQQALVLCTLWARGLWLSRALETALSP